VEIAMTETGDTYQQQAYSYVRDKILSMEFKPGDRVADSSIASELNISRTPVREALQRLEIEGLLSSKVRRGWKVTSLTIKDIEDIFDLKCEIEGLIARKAAICEDDDNRKALKDLLNGMKEASSINDIDSWIEIDASLHHLLYVMAQNERAERIINNLNDQWHRLRTGFIKLQGRLDRATDQHEKVVLAILDCDPARADAAMHEHLNDVRKGLLQVLVTLILPYARNGL
jgi:DNA-binding GntR family transcriptional regulator